MTESKKTPPPARPAYRFQSPKMQRVYEDLAEAATCDDVVILLGENGTGKTALAKQIHEGSKRYQEPFVDINVATLHHELLVGDLFGVEPNTVTGINKGRTGLVKVADGGTIFCDEIGELELTDQKRLLEFVQGKTFRLVGGKKSLSLDVRLIFATNRLLAKMVELGTFREDLFHRMNQISITLPPLRELREDIIPLALHLCESMANEPDYEPSFTEELRSLLVSYSWPGNIRELENAMRGLVRRGNHAAVLGIESLRQEVREQLEWGRGQAASASASADTHPNVRSILLSSPPCPRHPRYERVMRTSLIEQIQQQHLATQRATVLLQTHRGGGRTLARQLASTTDRPVLWLVDSAYDRSLSELFFHGLTRDPSVQGALDFDRWLREKVIQEPNLLLILTEPRGPIEYLEAVAASVKALLDQHPGLHFLVIGNERLLRVRTDVHYSWLRLLPPDALFDVPELTQAEVEALLAIRGLPTAHAGVLMRHTAGHPWLVYELTHKQIFDDEAALAEVMFQLGNNGKLERHLQDPLARSVIERLLSNQPVARLSDPSVRHNPQRYAESRLYYDGFLIVGPNGETTFRCEAVRLLVRSRFD